MIFFNEYAYILCQNKLKLYSSTDFTPKGCFFKKSQMKTQKLNFHIIFEKAFYDFCIRPFLKVLNLTNIDLKKDAY